MKMSNSCSTCQWLHESKLYNEKVCVLFPEWLPIDYPYSHLCSAHCTKIAADNQLEDSMEVIDSAKV